MKTKSSNIGINQFYKWALNFTKNKYIKINYQY